MRLKFKHKLTIFYTNILCSSLYIKNLIFTKKLVLENFIYTNKIVIQGNEIVLNWRTTGCHKISIKNLGIIPGNVSHLNLTLKNKANPIEFIFYGIGGQKEIKNIEIKTNSPSVLNNFTPITNISYIALIPLLNEDLKKVLVNSFNYKEPKNIKLQKPITASQNLKINFEPFIKSNYPIKS